MTADANADVEVDVDAIMDRLRRLDDDTDGLRCLTGGDIVSKLPSKQYAHLYVRADGVQYSDSYEKGYPVFVPFEEAIDKIRALIEEGKIDLGELDRVEGYIAWKNDR